MRGEVIESGEFVKVTIFGPEPVRPGPNGGRERVLFTSGVRAAHRGSRAAYARKARAALETLGIPVK